MSKPHDPFCYFNSSPEVIRLVVMMYVRFPLSLRDAEDLLFERGIDICHETVRLWWTRFGPIFASGAIKSRRGVVTVTDRERLQEVAGESYGSPEAEYRRLLGEFESA